MIKNNIGVRIVLVLFFLAMSGVVMYAIYSFSAENGNESNTRSEVVTEKLKSEVTALLNENEDTMELGERIKYFVITHSPYGSDWNSNIRKLAHFSIYFCLAFMVYTMLAILGTNKTLRFILTIIICFCFALGDEFHQSFTGRTANIDDVFLDSFGALVSTSIWTFIAIIFRLIFPKRRTSG